MKGGRLQLRRLAESPRGRPCGSRRSRAEQQCEVRGALIWVLLTAVSQVSGIQFSNCQMSKWIDEEI